MQPNKDIKKIGLMESLKQIVERTHGSLYDTTDFEITPVSGYRLIEETEQCDSAHAITKKHGMRTLRLTGVSYFEMCHKGM